MISGPVVSKCARQLRVVAVLIRIEVAVRILGHHAGALRESRRRCLRADWSARARRRTPAESACARGSRSRAGTASPCSRAPRRPSRRRCRCCPTSRRRSSGPAAARPDASPSAIIRAAARSFTEPPGILPLGLRVSSTPASRRSKRGRRTSGVRADQVEHVDDARFGGRHRGRGSWQQDIERSATESPNYNRPSGRRSGRRMPDGAGPAHKPAHRSRCG